MGAKYLIRLDDACPTMDVKKWKKVELLLGGYNIKPIVAVIPNNRDPSLMIDEENEDFWEKVVLAWKNKGWTIALHGYDHVYLTHTPGLVPINKDSEFAGVSLKDQKEKIKRGINIFGKYGIRPKVWVAPSHSFDENTLSALREVSEIDTISDGIGLFPYREKGYNWIPQQLSDFKLKRYGVWTICLHPNTMSQLLFRKLERFLQVNSCRFVACEDITEFQERKRWGDLIYAASYWVKLYLVRALHKQYSKFRKKLK